MNTLQSSPDSEFSPMQATTVVLPQTDVDWAFQVCQQVENTDDHWPSFLRAIALKGFQQWLENKSTKVEIAFDTERVPPAGVNCKVNGFRLCLLAQGSLSDEFVDIPKVTLESPDEFAHLYVLVEVQEEAARVTILSSLARERLLSYQRAAPSVNNTADNYILPVQAFDTAPENLLTYLNYLELKQVITAAKEDETALSYTSAHEERRHFNRQVINVGHWLKDQLDEVADNLAWTLLPPMNAMRKTTNLRNPVEEIETVLKTLEERAPDVTVPSNARGAYTDCPGSALPIRLYAFTWPLFETEVPEWSLLLCLGPNGSSRLPPGIRLIIREGQAKLMEKTLDSSSESSYLYGQVIGQWDDQFEMCVSLPNGIEHCLPPFAFQPEG